MRRTSISTAEAIPATWRYEIQREHVRGESPWYSLMVGVGECGYYEGLKKTRLIRPIKDDSVGTVSSVRRVIRRHQAYIAVAVPLARALLKAWAVDGFGPERLDVLEWHWDGPRATTAGQYLKKHGPSDVTYALGQLEGGPVRGLRYENSTLIPDQL